jgi:hypothetical protein
MQVAEAVPIIHKIHETGYWRINIRPTVFESDRVASLSACRDIIEKCKVSMSGWGYPNFYHATLTNGQDWIEASDDREPRVGYWKFYQSGQFIHHLACWEDYDYPNPKILRVLSTVLILTATFEFAARLAEQNILRPAAEILIELGNMDRRSLAEPSWTFFRSSYTAGMNQITAFERVVTPESLLGTSQEFALDAALALFERFDWVNPPREILAEEQRKILEGRG